MPDHSLWFVVGVGIVAFLYSFVGHGGASGYLAILALSAMMPAEVQMTALTLNLVVAGVSFGCFSYAKHLNVRLTWPLILGSVPLSFLGASLKLSNAVFYALVGITLCLAAARLLFVHANDQDSLKLPPVALGRVGIGATIGLLSGLVGVGGGIFLSPVLLLSRWATAKQAAATSAIFIVANSLAGIGAKLSHGGHIPPSILPLCIAGFVGAIGGSTLGAFHVPNRTVKAGLGVVLLLAAVKLVVR